MSEFIANAWNDGDGTVHCGLCGWSRKCQSMEEIEHFLGIHVWKEHGRRLAQRKDRETGEIKDIPRGD